MTSPQRVASYAEEILDESMNGQESLRLTWRFELSHLPLTLPRRLMRDFGAIVLVLLGAMADGRHDAPMRRRIASQLVGDQPSRHAALTFQQLAKTNAADAAVLVVTDGGSENFGEVDQLLEDSRSLSPVLAQIDIVCSNEWIEAFWRRLKHAWLFLNTLDSTEAMLRLVAFYIREHNGRPRAPFSAAVRQTRSNSVGRRIY